MTKEEWQAFCLYRRGDTLPIPGGNINKYLRKDNSTNAKTEKIIDLMSKAISKAQLNKNIATFRNLCREENNILNTYNINDTFEFVDFKGTHAKEVIKKNNSAAYAIFLIPKGYPCAYVDYWWECFSEKELLINIGAQCKLLDIKTVFNKNCYIIQICT